MQGKRVKQINNYVITQIGHGFVAWTMDGRIVDVNSNFDELCQTCYTTTGFVNSNRPSVLIDVDSTLADFHESLRLLLRDLGYDYHPERLTDYYGENLPDGTLGVSWNVARTGMCTSALYTDRYFKLYPKVDEALAKLRKVANTIGYTGAECNEEIYQMRIKFCKEHKLVPNVFIGSKAVLAGYQALFDDNPYIIDKWVKSGAPMRIYMIDQPYNRHININKEWGNRVVRCASFYDAVNKYLATLKKK